MDQFPDKLLEAIHIVLLRVSMTSLDVLIYINDEDLLNLSHLLLLMTLCPFFFVSLNYL